MIKIVQFVGRVIFGSWVVFNVLNESGPFTAGALALTFIQAEMSARIIRILIRLRETDKGSSSS